MFSSLLSQRAAENKPIKVGVIGAGKFGGGLVAQLSRMQSMKACTVAEEAKSIELIAENR
ncbi:hypothetical protein ACFL6S_27840 [Candidatus Poribacteria bacterium]